MHRSEAVQLVRCEDCGVETAGEVDRAYLFGNEGVLCFSCAVRRGGVYDGRLERWDQAPDVTDLLGREQEM